MFLIPVVDEHVQKSYLVLTVATLGQKILTAFVNVNSTICKIKWEIIILKKGTKQLNGFLFLPKPAW